MLTDDLLSRSFRCAEGEAVLVNLASCQVMNAREKFYFSHGFLKIQGWPSLGGIHGRINEIPLGSSGLAKLLSTPVWYHRSPTRSSLNRDERLRHSTHCSGDISASCLTSISSQSINKIVETSIWRSAMLRVNYPSIQHGG